MEAGGSSVGSGNTSRACPFLRRQSTKRSFSDMNTASRHTSASHNADVDSLFVQDDHYDNEHAVRRRRLEIPDPRTMPGHYPGDGLDYRRPVIPRQPHSQVIDLTAESPEARRSAPETYVPHHSLAVPPIRVQRLPRYDRNIISISDEDEEGAGEAEAGMAEMPGAADEQQGSAEQHPRYSVLRRPPHRGANPGVHAAATPTGGTPGIRRVRGTRDNLFMPVWPVSRSITPHPSNMHDPIDLTAEADDDLAIEDEDDGDDDEVVHLDTRPLPGANLHRPDVGVRDPRANPNQDTEPFFSRHTSRLYERMLNYTGRDLFAQGREQAQALHREMHEHFHAAHEIMQEARVQADRAQRRMARQRQRAHAGGRGQHASNLNVNGFHMPQLMEYELPAFEMGLAGGNRPPSPQYVPPPDAAEGFTRSPGEDDVVVCPNCGDELAMGTTPQKQEVWVVKACGHAYCGDCAHSVTGKRSKSSSSRQTGKGKGRARDEPDDPPPPLRHCVVPDCGERTTKSAIIRIYSS